MKKVISIILVLIISVILLTTNSYAATSCSTKISANKSQVEQGSTVTLTFTLTKMVEIGEGVGALQGILEYDENIFEKVTATNITAKSGWDSITYGETTKKFATVRAAADSVKTDNDFMEIVFTVKAGATLGNTTIKIKEVNYTVTQTGGEPYDLSGTDVVGTLKIAEKSTTSCEHTYITAYNETDHWKKCSKCDAIQENSKVAHTFTWKSANEENHTGTCAGCEYVRVEKHTYGTDNKCTKCGAIKPQNNNNNNNTNNNTNNNANNNTNNSNTNNNANTNSNTTFPKTGVEDFIIPSICVLTIIAIISFLKYRSVK